MTGMPPLTETLTQQALQWSHEKHACEDLLVRMVRATSKTLDPRILSARAQALRFLQNKGLAEPEQREVAHFK